MPKSTRKLQKGIFRTKRKKFVELISSYQWDEVTANTDANSAYDAFISTFALLYDRCFPHLKLKKKETRKAWISRELYNRIKSRNRIFQTFLKTRSEDDFRVFKSERNKLNSDIKRAKQEYYMNKFTPLSGNSNLMWKAINEVMNRVSITNKVKLQQSGLSDVQIANAFNAHFTDVGSSSQPNVSVTPWEYISNRCSSTLFLVATDEREVQNMISSLKDSCAAGADDVKVKPLKAVSEYISIPLAHICNLILSTGVFPNKMKLARVTVIHKGGPVNDMNNCRPISVLSVFAKIAEHVINKRLGGFLNTNKIIAQEQYGFCKK